MNTQSNAVMELARRYNVDLAHAHQVECLAGTLFMELQALHGLSREDRKLLEYSATLHDIGYFVSARGHHRHALQMIMLEPLPEFTRAEKTLLANLARYHRKALPTIDHTAYGMLSEADRRRVELLAPLLRLADALDRSHMARIKELFCDISEDTVTIHCGTEEALTEEIAAVGRKADMFHAIYRREVRINIVTPRLPVAEAEAEFAYEILPQ